MGQRRDQRTGPRLGVADDDERSTAVTVVQTVAEAAGEDPRDLPPLGERVDPDALCNLLSDPASDVRVEFQYADHRVLVGPDGEVSATPRA